MHIVPKKALMDPLARLARGNCWVKPFAYAHGDPGTVYNVVHYQLYRPVVWSQASQPEENAIVSGPGGELMRVTRAITHIRLCDANHAKIEALDGLAAEYLRLCQAYTTYFCTEAEPDGYLAPCFESPLSQRWQRAAIQHAAGIAQSWRSNYATAVQEYLAALAAYEEDHEPDEAPPEWRDWNTPVLKEPVIQANANVALLQPSEDSSFDYWLTSQRNWLGVPPNAASVPARSRAPIVPRSAIAVMLCPERIAPTSKRFAVWCAGTRTMPT
jgi:hypothetical protein